MIRTYELRLRPTKAQVVAFEEILADSCETYNAALQERIEAWKLQRKSISYYDQQAQLTELRKDPKFAKIALHIQREPLRRIDRAFKAFFRRHKDGQKSGFPRFRSRQRYDSFAWSLNKPPSLLGDRLSIPNLGQVKFKFHREIQCEIKQIIVKRIGSRWVARAVSNIGPAPSKVAVSSAVGIDLGLTTFATLSDGTEIANPRFVRKHAVRIANAQKNLARKVRGSKNRIKAKEKTRRAYQRMADARKNFCHHVSKELVKKYDLIAHEDLRISNMAQGRLAKSIMDAAWGRLLFQLAYKAEEAGRYVIAVNPKNTSQICSGCGALVRKKLSERQHICVCGTELGRDHNAAINVLRLGRSLVGEPAEESEITSRH